MSKKLGKFLLFSAIAGAAAYGAYYYLQSKESAPSKAKNTEPDDDSNDFDEDLDEDVHAARERSYVSLNIDKAEAFASEAFQKAKEVISDSVQQVKETVKSVTENQSVVGGNFTDITDLHPGSVHESEAAESETVTEPETVIYDSAETEVTDDTTPVSNQTVEEFFNDAN